MEMSEDIFDMWKVRCPFLTHMRLRLPNAIKILEICACIHNLSIKLGGVKALDIFPEAQDARAPTVGQEGIALEEDLPPHATPDDGRMS